MDVITALAFAYLAGPLGLILLVLGAVLLWKGSDRWQARARAMLVFSLILLGGAVFAWSALMNTNFGL